MRALRVTLLAIGAFQLVLGLLFLAAPGDAAALLGFAPAAPPWVDWLFAMMAVRFLGYAYGMFAAARQPQRHRTWIDVMIIIQVVDWGATLAYLAAGDVHLRQVTTAAFMPALFVAALLRFRPWYTPGPGAPGPESGTIPAGDR